MRAGNIGNPAQVSRAAASFFSGIILRNLLKTVPSKRFVCSPLSPASGGEGKEADQPQGAGGSRYQGQPVRGDQ
jgi:hypothetical protein